MKQTLIAKPIIKDQYWIVTNGTEKVGNVQATGSGFEVKLHGNTSHFGSTRTVKKHANIEFQKLTEVKAKKELSFAVYPTTNKVFNSILDVKRKLHLFTKTPKSKCYYAAGWFNIKQGSSYESIFCPKYIFVQRYDYTGPYKTETESKGAINT